MHSGHIQPQIPQPVQFSSFIKTGIRNPLGLNLSLDISMHLLEQKFTHNLQLLQFTSFISILPLATLISPCY